VSAPQYCSQKCRRGQKQGHRRSPRPPVMRKCGYCGRKIMVQPSRLEKSKSGLVFCSHTCSAQYQSSRLPHDAQCHYCGKTFHRSPSELKRSTNAYCCRECYEKARQEGTAAKRKRRALGGRGGDVEVHCANCGKAVYVRPSKVHAAENHYCSRECKRLHQTTTGSHVPRERLKRQRGRCEICGLAELDILVVHHKDRNPRNNKDSNLMVLCPNCHSRIHYKDKN